MQNPQNLPLIILAVIIVFLVLNSYRWEPFSQSGLAISDRYCSKLADVYYRPDMAGCRCGYRRRICDKQRRETIDDRTGNYYTEGHILV